MWANMSTKSFNKEHCNDVFLDIIENLASEISVRFRIPSGREIRRASFNCLLFQLLR